MVSLASLWLPILIAAVLVFVVSSVIHMLLGYHANDFQQVPQEEQVAAALRPFAIPPGNYMLPKPSGRSDMQSPAYQEKLKQGPVMMMTVYPNGMFSMGKPLVQWFIYCLVVGLFAGYVASRTLDPGTAYLQVFRVTGTVAFAGYGLALMQNAIWYRGSWGTTAKNLFDALIYALLTAGTFGWRWPGA